MTLTMADSITPANLPPGFDAYAGYVDGSWPDAPEIRAKFPGKQLVAIAARAADDADCLDVEPFDATTTQVPGWVQRQHARGIAKPIVYASISNMLDVLAALTGAGIARSQVRLWSAHYGTGMHICGPSTCRYFAAMTPACDGTQHTDQAQGLNGSRIDASILVDGFFGATPPPPSNWQEDMMRQLPTLRPGAKGADVRSIQGLCCARGHTVTVDGSFGPLTETAVKAVQASAQIAQDGIVGQQTWQVLVLG